MKSKFSLIIFIALLGCLLTEPVIPQDTLWTRTYGTPYSDGASDILINDDLGFIIAGDNDAYDGYIVRTDSIGNIIWDNTIGGSGIEALTSICNHSSGYVAVGTTSLDPYSERDAWLVCLSNDGDTLWSRIYGGEDDDGFSSIAATDDDGYIMAGTTHSFGQGEAAWYVLKTNVNGDSQWTHTYGSTAYDVAYGIRQVADGGYVICGFSDSRAYLVKTDSYGTIIWDDRYEGPYYTRYSAVLQTADFGYIAVGTSDANGGEKMLVVKFDSLGGREWVREYGTVPYIYTNGKDVRQADDGGYMIVGHIYRQYDPLAAYMLRINSAGDTIWSETYHIPGIHNMLFTLEVLNSNEYVAAGQYDWDMWLMKFREPSYCCEVDMVPDDDPIIVQPGGSFGYTGTLINSTDFSLAFDVWVGVIYEDQFFQTRLFEGTEPLEPGEFLTRHFRQNVPNYAPVGDYRYIAYGGNYPSKCDSVWFDFTVTGDGRLAGIDGEVIARSPKGDEAIPDPLHDNGNRLLRFAFAASRCDRGNDGIDGFILPPASGWTVEEITSSGGQPSRADTKSVDAGAPTGGVDASPNPFNAITTITYQLPEAGNVNLSVYNLSGQRIATLVDGVKSAGEHTITWDASEYSSGIYFYRLVAGDEVFTKRMTLLK